MRLVLTDVGHRFPASPWLFRRLGVVLRPGRSYALVGPSGSGKSTLMSLIAGWGRPSEGSIRREDITKVNWVFQSPYGMPRRTAIDHVALPFLSRGYRRPAAEGRAGLLLAEFGLATIAYREFRALSGGEAQRLMLARAVAASPQLLLVDEPTAQLDVMTARKVNEAISAMVSADRILLVATHDEHTRDSCTDRLDLVEFSFQEDEPLAHA